MDYGRQNGAGYPSGGVHRGVPAPVLNPSVGGLPLARGTEESITRKHFDSRRVVDAGGRVVSEILPQQFVPFEQLYRRLPEEGMFSPNVSPNSPFKFELGAFTVPPQMTLYIFDIRPDIYRFSGVDPGDYVPIEARRFGSIMGFDITVSQQHQGNLNFELSPVPIQFTSQQAFADRNLTFPQANASQFAVGQANQFANAAGSGASLQPQRPFRYGALSIPWTLYATAGQTVQATCVIFRPIPSPIAFIEYDIAGLLVPKYWSDQLADAIKPPKEELPPSF